MRDLTADESKTIIENYIKEGYEYLNFKNHGKHNVAKNTFRFTIDFASLDFFINLMEDDRIKDVFFNPSAPPPGGSIDGISLRYKVYVTYLQVEGE